MVEGIGGFIQGIYMEKKRVRKEIRIKKKRDRTTAILIMH